MTKGSRPNGIELSPDENTLYVGDVGNKSDHQVHAGRRRHRHDGHRAVFVSRRCTTRSTACAPTARATSTRDLRRRRGLLVRPARTSAPCHRRDVELHLRRPRPQDDVRDVPLGPQVRNAGHPRPARLRQALWGALVLAYATFGMADAAQKEPDVADLPPEAAQWVVELRVRAVRESDGRPVPHTALRVDGGNEAFGRWQKTDHDRAPTGGRRAATDRPLSRVLPPLQIRPSRLVGELRARPEHGGHGILIRSGPARSRVAWSTTGAGRWRGATWTCGATPASCTSWTDGAGRFRVDRLTEGEPHRSPLMRPASPVAAPSTAPRARVGPVRSPSCCTEAPL